MVVNLYLSIPFNTTNMILSNKLLSEIQILSWNYKSYQPHNNTFADEIRPKKSLFNIHSSVMIKSFKCYKIYICQFTDMDLIGLNQ